MINEAKWSVFDRVGLMVTSTVGSNSFVIGAAQAALGYNCKKAFMMAATMTALDIGIAFTARSYKKLSMQNPAILSEAPCEPSWIEKQIFPDRRFDFGR